MAQLVILGTANIISDAAHENTHMALQSTDGIVLIDCGANPPVSLQRAGLKLDQIQALIVTHFHPDHIAGTPILLLDLWLLGRKQPLHIHGTQETLAKLQTMMDLFEWNTWPEFYPVIFKPVELTRGASVLEMSDVLISAAPTHHHVSSIAIKIVSRLSGRSVVYSGDTSPCDAVVDLARGADILLHEASGVYLGHSSAAMAGSIARQAGVGRLALIHYDVSENLDRLVAEARSTFDGLVTVTQDLDVFEL